MAITYTWNVKHLNTDMRGYADTMYCELSATDGEQTQIASNVISFGGADYKPTLSWTQDQIDSFAETIRPNLELQLSETFNKAKVGV